MDRHAFITGGGSGIGLAIARALARDGWVVTIAGRNEARLLDAARTTLNARIQPLDVTEAAAAEAAIRAAADAGGPITLLVNNAGAVISGRFEETSFAAWGQMLDANLMGSVYCAHAVLPGMKARGQGRIVNIASTAGLIGYRYVTAYVAAKHALVGFTKALALEVAQSGVTVNAVCPGYTDTQIIDSAVKLQAQRTNRPAEDALARFTGKNPQARLVKPEEVAASVLWLASEAAAAVTGIALPIDGGEVA